MADVTLYTTSWCGFCRRAKDLLDRKQIAYTDIDIETTDGARAQMEQRSGGHTVPQIFIDGGPIGGCDELYALDANGRLDTLVQS